MGSPSVADTELSSSIEPRTHTLIVSSDLPSRIPRFMRQCGLDVVCVFMGHTSLLRLSQSGSTVTNRDLVYALTGSGHFMIG